jgi:hypothetical protein
MVCPELLKAGGRAWFVGSSPIRPYQAGAPGAGVEDDEAAGVCGGEHEAGRRVPGSRFREVL